MFTSKIAAYAKYFILPAVIWIISVFIVEGFFRILGDRPTEDKKGFYAQFTNGSYKLAPDMDVSSQWASGPFSVHTDSLGLRCDALRYYAVKKEDAIDILFIGDSQGFGNGVSFEDTIAGGVAVLAKETGARVANASVGGHSLQNQLQLVRWLRDQQDVRVAHFVILLTPAMSTACDSFTRAVVGQDGRLYDKEKTGSEMAMIWLKTHVVTYARLRNAIRNLGIGVDPSGAVPFILQIFNKNSDEEKAVRKLDNCLADFRSYVLSQGATLSVVYVPLTIEVAFSPVRQAAEARGLSLDPNLPLRVCNEAMSRLNIPIFSLRTVLENANSNGQRLHLKGDFHYDANVSRECARYLWQELEPTIKNLPSTALHQEELTDGRSKYHE